MLKLSNLHKVYHAGQQTVHALKGIDLEFRDREFAAILGPSGCGKTTLLNIIGGLDHYSEGELCISGKETKQFTNNDWDTYRNHKVGFVFQNYYLIPHQSVLANVELTLTLAGLGKTERRERACSALKKVGLEDQIHKKPNELSGGQMQRVAIARALVGEPEIILADEPTGALDSETGIQIMKLLHEISRQKLVIMVSHNAELASQYADRIITLKDGLVQSDTRPVSEKEINSNDSVNQGKKPSMNLKTALSLSFRNLLTKKARTVLTAFAGSIGIVGIALILSISTGVQNYINRIQEDTLSGYPIEIEQESMDMTSMMASFMIAGHATAADHDMDKIYSNGIMSQMLNSMNAYVNSNDLSSFMRHIIVNEERINPLVSDIQYGYDTPLLIYAQNTVNGTVQANPSQVLNKSGLTGDGTGMISMLSDSAMGNQSMMRLNVFEELLDNPGLLEQQFEILSGRMPTQLDELALIVDKNNEISDYTLYSLGIRDQNEIAELTKQTMGGNTITIQPSSYTLQELMDLSFSLVLPTDYYVKNDDGTWVDRSDDPVFLDEIVNNGLRLKVTAVIRPREESIMTSAGIGGGIGYTSYLPQYVIEKINNSQIVQEQTADPKIDILTGMPFGNAWTDEQILEYIKTADLPQMYRIYIQNRSDEELIALARSYMKNLPDSDATYEGNLKAFGVSSVDSPSSIRIYAKDFASKEKISEFIDQYNESVSEEKRIHYTDYIGMMMSSVSAIVDAISYVLIAFVAVSLIVSSIMIGIITYISVLERTKEIGILRAIGASKHDIRNVFNAETLLVGFASGVIGICLTILFNGLINMILRSVTDVAITAVLPTESGIILICISMLLTFIAGLIPSGIAANKDPVIALRTE